VHCIETTRLRHERGEEVTARLGVAAEQACVHAAQSGARAAMIGAGMEVAEWIFVHVSVVRR
jgi:hypothetical protein